MIPGPDQIVACPKCNGLAKYRTLLSGNTFGARVWTDGKQDAPDRRHCDGQAGRARSRRQVA